MAGEAEGETFEVTVRNKCPLCGDGATKAIGRRDVRPIVEEWRRVTGFEVKEEFRGTDVIELLSCMRCGLQFFEPSTAGSAGLYSKLETIDWYYSEDKWEYERAVRFIEDGMSVLEVGCGRGHFVRRCLQEKRARVCGLELNPSAVARAVSDGLPVTSGTLTREAETGSTYDVVCHFQVLEHVPDPGKFLSECIRVIKPGGHLVFSVPDSGGFLRLNPDNIWNLPPHHVTRWTTQTLRYLPSLFNLSLAGVWHEPLSLCHVDGVTDLYLDRVPDVRYLKGLSLFVGRRVVKPLLVHTGLYRCLRGHSLLACYTKTPSREQTFCIEISHGVGDQD